MNRITRNKIIADILEDDNISSLSSSSSSSENNDSSNDDELHRLKRTRIENFVDVIHQYSDEEFRKHFRLKRHMTNALQEDIVNTVSSDPSGWPKVSAEIALLLTCWYLGNKETFRQISDRFNVTESCAHTIIKKVTQFFTDNCNNYIEWPQRDEMHVIAGHFLLKKGIPRVIGAIDGCHIAINKPKLHGDDYINRKGYASILLQEIADNRMKFRNIYVGEPGSLHDARVLRRSKIFKVAENAIEKNFVLLGDSAYPSLPWLVPFKDNGHLSENQRDLNYRHSATRIIIENAFGLLKGRFRRLRHFDNRDLKLIKNCIITSCILHNICIEQNDLGESLDLESNDDNQYDLSNYEDNREQDCHQENIASRNVLFAELFENDRD